MLDFVVRWFGRDFGAIFRRETVLWRATLSGCVSPVGWFSLGWLWKPACHRFMRLCIGHKSPAFHLINSLHCFPLGKLQTQAVCATWLFVLKLLHG